MNQNTSGEFRIYNDSTNKNFVVEWKDADTWTQAFTFNWDTGSYSGTDGSTGQVNDWISLEDEYIQPMIEFGELMNEGEEGSLTFGVIPENSLGLSSFSVTEGSPEAAPDYAPSSLLWKKLTFAGLPILVMANEQGSAKIKDLNSGDWEDQSYQWDASGTTATLYLDGTPEVKDKLLKLTFTSNSGGTVEWENWDMDTNGENFLKESGTDTFTIGDFTKEDLPVSKGWMWFDHYPWVYSHVEGGWLYFHASGSKLMVYSNKDQVWREMSE